jgi:S-DNA-T family DNA segregation ATPase FtsK/SpoIIIE
MSKRRKRGRKKKKGYSIELFGIILIFISILAIGEFGFVGYFFANIIRFFVGETYQLFSALGILLGIHYIFYGENPKFSTHRFIGSLLLYIALLIWLHLRLFEPIMEADVNIISATWRRLPSLFSAGIANQSIGGGMIGAVLYAVSYFLFANVGTYFSIALLVFIGIMSIGNFSYNALFTELKKIVGTFFNWVKNIFSKIKATFQQNIQVDSKNKKKTSKEKSVDKKASKQEEENEETPPRKRREPVPIEGMKQTSLPIEGMKSPEAAEKQTAKEKATEEVDDSEELSINFVSDDENEDYKLPPLSLLNKNEAPDQSNEYSIIEENIKKLEDTFESFGVNAKVVKANLGPAVTKFEIEPATGVKVSRIVNLADDIALALAAKDIRMEAPIPGKALIGIEVPNSEITAVYFNEVMKELEQTNSDHPLEVPLGKDIGGNVTTADLSKMPHLLIAGATGSGKSVGINVIISSLLMRTKPHEVKMMLIDPKMVELNVYDGIPHLLTPVVTKPKKAARALQNVVEEMEKRYELFAMSGTRNVESYNEHLQKIKEAGEEDVPSKLPYIVVIVDELADLMMVAAKEVEDSIIRLAQMARAAGIHMILATQRPSVDVITGLIKANVPSRIAFATSSGTDSRTILDANGAEKLLGRGDMLFLPMGANQTRRVQGAFITDSEVQAITEFVRNQQDPNYVEEMIPTEEPKAGDGGGSDELYEEAFEIVRELDTASISLLQRRLRIGYNRAANIMDDLEANGIVSPQEGSKPRDVLVSPPEEEEDLNLENETTFD